MVAAYYQVRPEAEKSSTIGCFRGMLAAQARIVASGRWTHGPSTLMAVLGLQRAEVANCKVIRWLLDPLAPHGLGTEMLHELSSALHVELDHPAMATVLVEVARPGGSRADVVILGQGWTLVIEAKVDAPEGPDQAASLERDWPTATSLVFLTRGGTYRPRTAEAPGRWTPISWMWFADTADRLLARCAPGTPTSERARHALREWVTSTSSGLI